MRILLRNQRTGYKFTVGHFDDHSVIEIRWKLFSDSSEVHGNTKGVT